MNKLNVKLGDSVKITLNGQPIEFGVVTKVMPNGRFRIGESPKYWLASGVSNSRARKCEKSVKVEFINNKDDYIWSKALTIKRLQAAIVEIESNSISTKAFNLRMLNGMLDLLNIGVLDSKTILASDCLSMEVNHDQEHV